MNMTDVAVEVFGAGGHVIPATGYSVRVTHKPTGLVAEAEGKGLIQTRRTALIDLRKQVEQSEEK